jgi:hypothetical protein
MSPRLAAALVAVLFLGAVAPTPAAAVPPALRCTGRNRRAQ